MLREEAYRIVQAHAMRSWETGSNFLTDVENDLQIGHYLEADRLRQTFSLQRQLRYIDRIFDRVFTPQTTAVET